MPDQTKHLYEFPCPHCGEVHSFKDLQHQQLRMLDPDKPVRFVQCKECKKQFEVTDDRWQDMYRASLQALRKDAKTIHFT